MSTATGTLLQTSAPTPSPLLHTFRALRHRDFRLLWTGLAVSAIGTWMQILAQSLLVLKIMHGSAFALGCVSLAQASAFFLFALVGGSVADRVDKRRLLLATQAGSACLALLLGLLTSVGAITFWMILILAFLNGVLLSFDQPARGALIPLLVPRADLGNAISLQAMVFNGASTLGPALAGFGIAKMGYAGNFFLNAASFVGVIAVIFFLRVPVHVTHQEGTIRSVRAGFDIVRRDAVLPWVLSGYAAMLFLGPSLALILPVYAVNVLHIGPERLGLLFAAAGVGTIVGAIFVASLASEPRRGVTYLAGVFAWVAALAVFAFSRYFWLSLFGMGIFGFGQTLAGTITTTLLQTRVAQQMRGRMMSLNTLVIMGVRPLGDFPAGALIAAIGAPLTVAASVSLVGLYGLVLAGQRSVRAA